jgi:outer membrane protein assembly factor BamB
MSYSDKKCVLSFFLIAFLFIPAVRSQAEDWAKWRGPSGDGISQETNWTSDWPPAGPAVIWRGSVGTGLSAISISQGRMFTMGNADNVDTVFCLDAETGAERWRHSYASPLDARFFDGGPTATPTVDGDHVYTLGRQGQLFCVSAKSGKIKWSTNIQEATGARIPGWGFGGSPVVHGDMLLLNVGDAGAAVKKATGELIWKTGDRQAGYTTPLLHTVTGKTTMFLASGKFYSRVNAQTGKVLWQHRWLTRFGANGADPILAGEHLFISSGYNRGCALLDLKEAVPRVVWSNKDMQNQFSSCVLIDGFLYGIDGDTGTERALKCMELLTGEVKWSVDGLGSGSLIAAGGRLIILSEDGVLVIARAVPSAFKELARFQVLDGRCWTMPVLANGRIFCRTANGDVVCVNVRKRN